MFRKISFSLIYTILSIILVFSFLEVSLRHLSPKEISWVPLVNKFGTFASYRKTGYKAKQKYAGIPYTIEIDENNLRNFKNIPYKKPKNTIRILSLGDSLFEGPGLEKNELFSYFLNRELENNISDVNFEVINGAANGSFLLDYYLYLKNEGHKFLPDIVLIPWSKYDFDEKALNFINFNSIRFQKTGTKNIRVDLEGLKVEPPKSFIKLLMTKLNESYVYGLFSKNSQLLEKFRYRLNNLYKDRKREESNVKTLQKKIIKNLNSSKETIKKVSIFFNNEHLGDLSKDSQNISPIILNLIFKSTVDIIQKFGAQLIIIEMPDDEEALGVQTFRIPTDFFSQLDAKRLNLIQKTAEFQKRNIIPLYIPGDFHWTPAGSYLTAILTFNYLVENVLPPNISKQTRPIDLKNIKFVQKIRSANERILKYKDWSQYLLYLKANSLRNQRKYNQAILIFEKYLEISKNDYYAHYKLGLIYFRKKYFAKAENHFLKVAESSKRLKLKSLFKLGQTYDELEKYSKAIKTFKELIKECENLNITSSYEAYNALGLAYRDLNDFENAEISFKKATKMNPKSISYWQNLGNLYFDNKKFRQSILAYKNLINLDSTNVKILTITGLAYLQMYEVKSAKEMFEKVLQIQPTNKMARAILSQLTNQTAQ